jgi:hypothetical protein
MCEALDLTPSIGKTKKEKKKRKRQRKPYLGSFTKKAKVFLLTTLTYSSYVLGELLQATLHCNGGRENFIYSAVIVKSGKEKKMCGGY